MQLCVHVAKDVYKGMMDTCLGLWIMRHDVYVMCVQSMHTTCEQPQAYMHATTLTARPYIFVVS